MIVQSIKSHNPCFCGTELAIISKLTEARDKRVSQSLFLWKRTCNYNCLLFGLKVLRSQSLFLWKRTCNVKSSAEAESAIIVTILVFVEKNLQFKTVCNKSPRLFSHNPCFCGKELAIILEVSNTSQKNRSQSLFLWKRTCN